MKLVARFEILDEIIAGAFETYTARDPKNGETVLLHYLPAGVSGAAAEQFRMLVPGCPGEILEWGVDESTQRAFVITEYPRNRKQLFLWIRKLMSLNTGSSPTPAPRPAGPESISAAGAGTRMIEPSAIFGAMLQVAAAVQTSPPVPESPQASTRLFDPSAIFGVVPETATAAPIPSQAPESPPGSTRLFDPSSIFGAVPETAAAAPIPQVPESPPGPTRAFDPSAIFGAVPETAAAAPIPSQVSESPSGGTRLFDPSAIFGGTSQTTTPGSALATIPEGSPPGGTRLYDVSAIFGRARPASSPEPTVRGNAAPVSQETASGGATRMFDPAAIFGAGQANAPASSASASEAVAQPAESTTRMFDPAAIFGAVASPASSSGSGAQDPRQRGSQPVAPPAAIRTPTRVMSSVAVAQMLASTSGTRGVSHPSVPSPEPAEDASAPPAKAQALQPRLPYVESAGKSTWRVPVLFVGGFVLLAVLIVLFFLGK